MFNNLVFNRINIIFPQITLREPIINDTMPLFKLWNSAEYDERILNESANNNVATNNVFNNNASNDNAPDDNVLNNNALNDDILDADQKVLI